MKKLAVAVAALLLVVASFAAGTRWNRAPHAGGPEVQEVLYYACPMHPQYRSDHPGDCGSCGMRLEPVRSGDAGSPSGGQPAHMRPGTVQVSTERQQATGVTLGVAEQVAGRRTLRTTGRVAAAENATYPIVAGVEGWIRTVGEATTGVQVRRNQRLATFYSPEFAPVQQSWFAGLETFDRTSNGQVVAYNNAVVVQGVQRFEDTLRNMGVSDLQLQRMRKERSLIQDIDIMSPVDGFVLQRNVSAGLRFDRGFELYRIADLQRVWILADVYEHQRHFVRSGMTARVTLSHQNRVFSATVSHADPVFDQDALTLKLRLEADNPGFVLKPGMFVDVELPIELPSTLAVPADAIVDSGLRKTVFVDRGEGYFEPRLVETGWRVGDQVEILKGLMPGERIVISGTFLIDSESRMKAAADGIFSAAEDPVCGMQVDEKRAAAAGRTVEHGGRTFYFCADQCRRDFLKHPARYVKDASLSAAATRHAAPGGAVPVAARPVKAAPAASHDPRASRTTAAAPAAHVHSNASATSASHDTATDPVCGMDVDPTSAAAAGRTSEHDGRTYYFCADECKRRFDADPARYSHAAVARGSH